MEILSAFPAHPFHFVFSIITFNCHPLRNAVQVQSSAQCLLNESTCEWTGYLELLWQIIFWRNSQSYIPSLNALPEPCHLSSINGAYCPSAWTWVGLCKCHDECNMVEATLSTPALGALALSLKMLGTQPPRDDKEQATWRAIPMETASTKFSARG